MPFSLGAADLREGHAASQRQEDEQTDEQSRLPY